MPGWARAGAVARKYDNTFYKSDLCREFSIILPPRLQPPTTSILISTLLKAFLYAAQKITRGSENASSPQIENMLGSRCNWGLGVIEGYRIKDLAEADEDFSGTDSWRCSRNLRELDLK